MDVRFRIEEITSPADAGFDQAYRLFEEEFASAGELSRREVLERLLRDSPHTVEALRVSYHVLAAKDRHGQIAGARDCYAIVDRAGGLCVVFLAHTVVVPRFRRSGVATLLRAAPVALGERALADAGLASTSSNLMLAAEMDPVDPEMPLTVIRLVAYGRDGFAAIPPKALPYCQPDLGGAARGTRPEPIPLLAVVRHVGHEEKLALPARLAAAFVRHLYAVFGLQCRPEDLEVLRCHALDRLKAFDRDPVPLLRLPRQIEDIELLEPLLRATVLPLYPPSLGVRGAEAGRAP